MKFGKECSLILASVLDNGNAFFGLAGYNGTTFHDLPSDARIFMVDEDKRNIYIVNKSTFDIIKKEKLLHENLFPYFKKFKELTIYKG